MSDARQSRFNIPDVFWQALRTIGLEPSAVCVRHGSP